MWLGVMGTWSTMPWPQVAATSLQVQPAEIPMHAWHDGDVDPTHLSHHHLCGTAPAMEVLSAIPLALHDVLKRAPSETALVENYGRVALTLSEMLVEVRASTMLDWLN